MTLALQLFKNSVDAQEKLRLNLHSLSVSELLEYGRKSRTEVFLEKPYQRNVAGRDKKTVTYAVLGFVTS